MPVNPEIKIFSDPTQVAREAALEFTRLATTAVREQGRGAVALAGGSTPRSMYSLLADDQSLRLKVPWDKLHFFWGDERHVPPDHKDSNYHMAYEAMLSKVPVPSVNIHRIGSEDPDALKAADAYEQELRRFFQLEPGQLPRFDLVLLGMGPDGHTASLFPGTTALNERQRLVAATWVEKFNTNRITLTLPLLNNAANVIFLVCGAEKIEVLRTVLKSKAEPQYPAQLIRPGDGRLLWMLDESAAQALR
jgi:6-phosphogluconolactonase